MDNIVGFEFTKLAITFTSILMVMSIGIGVLQGLIQRKYQKKEDEFKKILEAESPPASVDLPSTIVVREQEASYDPGRPSQMGNRNKKEKITANVMEDLIKNYHGQALAQAAAQFWFSVVAAVGGFLFIVFMVSTSTSVGNFDIVIKTLPGAVISAVSALFFKQASETRQRATDLFDRLRQDNQRKEAIKLIDTIPDLNLRSVVQAQLALKIGGIDTSLSDLHSIIDTKKN